MRGDQDCDADGGAQGRRGIRAAAPEFGARLAVAPAAPKIQSGAMPTAAVLPSPAVMYRALLRRDPSFEGVFWVGVRTTGIFCRPTCSARKPLRSNVRFFQRVTDALTAGFRPCRRCAPMQALGEPPVWAAGLLAAVDRDPFTRIRDADLRARELDPGSVRRWFRQQHGMTFQAYQRHRRLGAAMAHLHRGERVTTTAFRTGYESLSGFRDAVASLLGDTPTGARGKRVLRARQLTTPLGPMLAVADDAALHLLEFADRRMLATQLQRLRRLCDCVITPGPSRILTQVEAELAQYFAGERQRFDVPLALAGTPFQLAVWRQLLAIPCGCTRSYDDLATRLGRPGAQRAVGRANGDNRLAILVPCHRVVRADGSLCGYGGGVWRKQRLLEREGVVLPG